jgi:hypothetical protein
VQGLVDDDREHAPAIVESALMYFTIPGPPPKAYFTVEQGPVSGSVLLKAKSAGDRVGYEWQMSVDGGLTYTDLPRTMQAKTKVFNLEPGKRYWFRFRPVLKDGPGDWCDPVSIIVK